MQHSHSDDPPAPTDDHHAPTATGETPVGDVTGDDAAGEDVSVSASRTLDDGKRLEFADVVEIRASKDELWATITDPETLTACVPGAESFERVTPTTYTLAITRGVSHLTVSLTGGAEFVELNEPDWVVVTGFAHDTTTGSDFDVLAGIELTDVDDETVRLSYNAEVTFTGGVATLGKTMLRPIVRRDVAAYFDNVRAFVETDEE